MNKGKIKIKLEEIVYCAIVLDSATEMPVVGAVVISDTGERSITNSNGMCQFHNPVKNVTVLAAFYKLLQGDIAPGQTLK